MAGFILRRLLSVLFMLWLVWSLVFIVGHLLPGRQGDLYDSPQISREEEERLRRVYGLDAPLPLQYLRQFAATVRGDLALSTAQGRPVAEVVAPAIGPTLLLAGSALVLQFVLGTLLGVWAALRAGRLTDHMVSGVALTAHSIPVFWLGLVLMMVFSLQLGWLPPSHMRSLGQAPSSRVLDLLWHLLLPLLTLTLAGMAVVIRHARSSLLEALQGENLHAARARGLPRWRLVLRHGLGQAILPLLTLLGLSLPALLSGALLVEVVFSWPGLGQITYQAILARDFPVVQATTLLTTAMVVAGNATADLSASLADPRVRPAGGPA